MGALVCGLVKLRFEGLSAVSYQQINQGSVLLIAESHTQATTSLTRD